MLDIIGIGQTHASTSLRLTDHLTSEEEFPCSLKTHPIGPANWRTVFSLFGIVQLLGDGLNKPRICPTIPVFSLAGDSEFFAFGGLQTESSLPGCHAEMRLWDQPSSRSRAQLDS
tara:strand:- start:314 stop:658 length:345 start_codon:yes stop_codon:yes gene_type:complete